MAMGTKSSVNELAPRYREFSLQPLRGKIQKIRKREFRLADLNFPTKDRQFFHESSILAKNFRAARQDLSRAGTKPITHRRDCTSLFKIMRSNVLARDVRNEFLKSVSFAIKN
jgi:hypothetical protein